MSERDLAVVLVSWNVRDLLIACLDSVRAAVQADGLDAEIWVIDNASCDGSAEAVSDRFRDVHLFSSPVNLWFGGGNNLALRALGFSCVSVPQTVQVADGELIVDDARLVVREGALPRYVLLLNPDTLVRKGTLGEMVCFLDRQPRVGVCGPRLVYGDGRFQHAAFRFPSLAQTVLDFWPIHGRLTESSLNGRYPRHLYEGGEPFAIDHPLGAAMLFRRQVIEQTGGFDLGFRMYVEEIDWCMRVRQAGWEAACVPQAEVVHYGGQSTRQVRPQMVVALWRSRYILFQKHYSACYRWAVRCIIRAGMRAKIRRTQQALGRGELDAETAQVLVDAYRQVIAM